MNFEKISYEQLESLAGELNTASQRMQDTLDTVSQLLSQIGTTEVWQGTTAEQVRQKFDQLVAKFPEFVNATGKCSTHIISVVENYRSTDTSVANN